MSISVEGITKVFKGRKKGDPENVVLKDVSFNVEEGEFVSLLGPSGCGKTTTLTIIAGFRKANEGKIVVNGNEVKKPGTDRSFMFQNYALFPWLRVGENIEYPMKKMKLPKADRKAKLKELLEMAQLTAYEHYYIHEISGGMKQRLGIAQALLNDPKLLILDEPTAGLDPKERVRFRNLIEELGKNNIVLLSTHIVSDIEHIADQVLIMKDGQLIYQGKWEETREDLETFYLNQFETKQE